MNFNVSAKLTNGVWVFNGITNFLPRKGEEIEANGIVYIVDNVRYILKNGDMYGQPVQLTLRYGKN